MKKYLIMALCVLFASCSSFKAERMTIEQGDEKALEITDEWITTDTKNAVKFILNQMVEHKGFREYLAKYNGRPKLFVGEIKNGTKNPYFPIADLSDEFLTELSMSGDYVLIDKASRDSILKEIQFQNDGLVSVKEAKQIGRMSGADLIIYGDVRENSSSRKGKTVKEYSVNIRMTEIEKASEVLRVRYTTTKYSEQSSFGW
ncbi:MAG: Curli production assembly/transport component CsgG [Alphaproteobacteria bacterium ADurb.Bin438]|nr:MAG: Curli production assembly/transport component CsgG [Alphaproteobacteria bacterium ADurb.Bin438]